MPQRALLGWLLFVLTACDSGGVTASTGAGSTAHSGNGSSNGGSGGSSGGSGVAAGNTASAGVGSAGTGSGNAGTSGQSRSTTCMPGPVRSCSGDYGYTVCGTTCCTSLNAFCCQNSSQCYATKLDAENFCDGPCIDQSAGAGSGGAGGDSGGACPCASLGTQATAACSPDPLAPACYCAQAYVNDCLAKNAADCMADAAAAAAEASRLRQAAVEENGSCHPP